MKQLWAILQWSQKGGLCATCRVDSQKHTYLQIGQSETRLPAEWTVRGMLTCRLDGQKHANTHTDRHTQTCRVDSQRHAHADKEQCAFRKYTHLVLTIAPARKNGQKEGSKCCSLACGTTANTCDMAAGSVACCKAAVTWNSRCRTPCK